MRFLLLLPLFLTLPAHAAPLPPPPKTLVLLTTGLAWDDLLPRANHADPLADVRAVAEAGGLALLNTAVSGEATDAAAFLSIGAGERMAAPNERGPRVLVDGVPLTVADVAVQAYPVNAREGAVVRPVYFRRFGMFPPPGAACANLGVPLLQRIQPAAANRAARVGALGEALTRAGKNVALFGDARASLAAMDACGIVGHGSVTAALTPQNLPAALSEADVVIASMSAPRDLRALCRAALPRAQAGELNVLVASVAPPRTTDGTKWRTLGFVAACGPAFAPGSFLTSPTTRARALAANVDLAPTICVLQNVPFASGPGHVLEAVPDARASARYARLGRGVDATTRATVPLLVSYGVFALGAGLASVFVLGRGDRASPRACAACRFALLATAAALPALLLAGVLAPPHVWQYGLLLGALSAALAYAAAWAGERHRSPLGLLFLATTALIFGDMLAGSPLVSGALLSGYYLSGVRFYGMGNEYTGVLLGAAVTGWGLLAPLPAPVPGLTPRPRDTQAYLSYLAARSSLGKGVRPHFALPLVAALLLTLALGLPFCGADAGGALAATVLFTLATLAAHGRRLRAPHIAGAFAAAFVVTGALALVDRLLPGGERSHIGEALSTGGSGGFAAHALDIVLRKLALSASITTNGWTLAAIALLAPIWLALARGPLGRQARSVLAARRPALLRVLPALGWGAGAAFVFNDSGAVAALLMLAPPTVAVIHEMLASKEAR